jgi:hypothetical protein
MGRMYTEPGEFMERVYKDHLRPVATRFIQAYQRALPGLPLVELLWRLHFSAGVMAHTLGAANLLRVISDGRCDPNDLEGTLHRMVAFTKAGLSAPVPVEAEHATH